MEMSARNVFGKFLVLFAISFLLAVGVCFILLSVMDMEQYLSHLIGERDLPLKIIIIFFSCFQ